MLGKAPGTAGNHINGSPKREIVALKHFAGGNMKLYRPNDREGYFVSSGQILPNQEVQYANMRTDLSVYEKGKTLAEIYANYFSEATPPVRKIVEKENHFLLVTADESVYAITEATPELADERTWFQQLSVSVKRELYALLDNLKAK